MNDLSSRERGIIALALGNLEKTIKSLPGEAVRWTPLLRAGEVARLRRKLTCPPAPPLAMVAPPTEPPPAS